MRSEGEHHKNLEATLRQVITLLSRHALVDRLAARTDTRDHALVQSLGERQHSAELEQKLNGLHPADAAFVLEGLRQDQRIAAWRLIQRERRGAILLELAAPVRAVLVELLDEPELAALGTQMEAEDFAELVHDLPQERVERVLARLGAQERAEVQAVLSFPAGSVGGLMQLDVVTVHADDTLEDAIASLRKRGSLPAQLTALTVVGRDNVLQGTLALDRLLVGRGSQRVSEAMNREPAYFLTTDAVEDAAEAFERYDLISAPVVNPHRQVVGMLTVDAVLDQVKQDSFKQSLSQVGLSEDEDLFAPIWRSSRKRWVWLGVNLFTAFVASRVVGRFEGSIEKLAALAALMPIVASIGGNTGNQTVALVIRGLALSQLTAANLRFLLRKELAIAVLNGTLSGLVMALATLLLYGAPALAGVMALAMLLNMLVASAVGVLCPLVLERIGRDPVMGSSILLTAITDSMGFLIFLGLASLLLL
ncbi:MAG TPA: magnesium transporter [Gammaproteobacteria bacterium]|nr:magnesium transporter [Gammaproteobacteria bacterium]